MSSATGGSYGSCAALFDHPLAHVYTKLLKVVFPFAAECHSVQISALYNASWRHSSQL